MQVDVTSLLRIKRRRNEATTPLDALLIEDSAPPSKRRKDRLPDTLSTESRGIFRFAETVPLDSFSTDNKTRQLRDRITALIRHPPSRAPSPSLSRLGSSSSLSPSSPSTPSRKLPSARASPLTTDRTKDVRLSEALESSKRARYRIIERQRGETEVWGPTARMGERPPEVMDSRDAGKSEAGLKIYEAVQEDTASRGRVNVIQDEKDEMMDNFGSMLEEYLTVQDKLTSSITPSVAPTPLSAPISTDRDISPEEEDTDEFVYDVYYRDLRPEAAVTLTADGFDVGSGAGLKRIGALAGLEEDQVIHSESESEEEDEADQDSNEENDYRNDYPDGESDDWGSEEDEEERYDG